MEVDETLFNERPKLRAFTLADAPTVKNKCIDCERVDDCLIIAYVNKLEEGRCKRELSEFRSLEEEFGCIPLFKEA